MNFPAAIALASFFALLGFCAYIDNTANSAAEIECLKQNREWINIWGGYCKTND
jgi:hypothetical protein